MMHDKPTPPENTISLPGIKQSWIDVAFEAVEHRLYEVDQDIGRFLGALGVAVDLDLPTPMRST